jgi:hypothetical protein
VPFVHPAIFIGALAAIALPVAVHLLLRRRRRPMPWAAMRFLLAAVRKQRRRLQLEQLILLLLRCALVVVLGTALARPLIGGQTFGRPPRDILIVIDDSLTSGVVDAAGVTDLDRHQERAARAVDAIDTTRGDTVAAIGLAGPARELAGTGAGPVRLRSLLGDLGPQASAADWPGASLAAASWLEGRGPGREAVILLLSGFRAGSAQADERLVPFGDASRTLIAPMPDASERSTIGVRAVRPVRPVAVASELAGPAGQVLVDVYRSGPVSAGGTTGRLTLFAHDATAPGAEPVSIGESVVVWAAGQTEQTVSISPRWSSAGESVRAGTAVLRAVMEHGSDALAGDNAAFGLARLKPALRVGVIGSGALGRGGVASFGPERWIGLALRPSDTGIAALDVRTIHPADAGPAQLTDLDAVVIVEPDALRPESWDEIARLTQRGGVVIITPGAEPASQRWPDEAERALGLSIRVDRDPLINETPLNVGVAPDQVEDGPLALLAGELVGLAAGVQINRHVRIGVENDAVATVPLTLSNGDPLLVAVQPGQSGADAPGLVVVLAVPASLEWSNVPARPLFVPVMQELVRQGLAMTSRAEPMRAGDRYTWPPDSAERIDLRRGAAVVRDRDADESGPLRSTAAYLVRSASGASLDVFAVNPDHAGARLAPRAAEDVAEWLAPWAGDAGVRWITPEDGTSASTDPVASALAAGEPRGPFDWPLLVLAGLIALAETGLARFASHAEARDAIGAGA